MPTVNGQPYPANRWRESGGTVLTAGAVTDGQFLKRSGSTIISGAASGAVLQTAYASTTALGTFTTTIPRDDTIPQNTEGTEALTCSITPLSASSNLLVHASGFFDTSASVRVVCALFRDTTADAIAARLQFLAAAEGHFDIEVRVAASSTSATTFKLRIGPSSAATIYLNGQGGTRLFGGVGITTMTIMELA